MTRASRARIGLCCGLLLLALAIAPQPAAAQEQTAEVRDRLSSLLDKVRQLARQPAKPTEPGDLVCLSESDAVADIVFRLHTQLMVASLACGMHYGDESAHQKYRLFTQHHAELLRQSQLRLRASLPGDPDKAFDAYRTGLANSESSLINNSSTPSYCRMRQARFESLILTNPEEFPDYARELAVRDRIYKEC